MIVLKKSDGSFTGRYAALPPCTRRLFVAKVAYILFLLACFVPLATAEDQVPLAGLNEQHFRKLADGFLSRMEKGSDVADIAAEAKDAEAVAAYWHAYRKAAVKGVVPWDDAVVAHLAKAIPIIDRLYVAHPGSVELLSLRLAYANESVTREYTKYMEKAFPFVLLAEAGYLKGELADELTNNFYFPFARMLSHALAVEKRGGAFLRQEQSSARFVLLDPKKPSRDDIRMWIALVRHYTEAPDRKERWKTVLSSFSAYEAGFSLAEEAPMTTSQALERLARTFLSRISE